MRVLRCSRRRDGASGDRRPAATGGAATSGRTRRGRRTERRAPRVARGDLVDLGRIESGELSSGSKTSRSQSVLAATSPTVCQTRIGSSSRPSRAAQVRADERLCSGGRSSRRSWRRSTHRLDRRADEGGRGAVWPGVDIRVIGRRRPAGPELGTQAETGAGAFVAQAYVLAMRGQVRDRRDPRRWHDVVIRLASSERRVRRNGTAFSNAGQLRFRRHGQPVGRHGSRFDPDGGSRLHRCPVGGDARSSSSGSSARRRSSRPPTATSARRSTTPSASPRSTRSG